VHRNLKIYPWHAVFTVEGISHGVYVLWLIQAKGLSMATVALLLALGDATLLLVEVPTGMLADRLGRRASLILGSLFQIAKHDPRLGAGLRAVAGVGIRGQGTGRRLALRRSRGAALRVVRGGGADGRVCVPAGPRAGHLHVGFGCPHARRRAAGRGLLPPGVGLRGADVERRADPGAALRGAAAGALGNHGAACSRSLGD